MTTSPGTRLQRGEPHVPPSSECSGEGTVAPHTPAYTGMPKPQPNLASPTSPSNLDSTFVGLFHERSRCRDGCKDQVDGRERSRRRWYLTVILLLYVGLVTSFCLNVSLLLKATHSEEDREESANFVSSTKSPIEESYSFACLAKGKVSYLVTKKLIPTPPQSHVLLGPTTPVPPKCACPAHPPPTRYKQSPWQFCGLHFYW